MLTNVASSNDTPMFFAEVSVACAANDTGFLAHLDGISKKFNVIVFYVMGKAILSL